MKKLLILALMFVSLGAFSQEPKESPQASFVVAGLSYHTQYRQYWEDNSLPKDYNEINIGFGIQYGEYRGVVFKNSYYKTSLAVLWVPAWNLTEDLKVGLRLGGAVGYGDTPVDMPVAPVVGAEIDWKLGNIHNVLGTLGYRTFTYHIQVDF